MRAAESCAGTVASAANHTHRAGRCGPWDHNLVPTAQSWQLKGVALSTARHWHMMAGTCCQHQHRLCSSNQQQQKQQQQPHLTHRWAGRTFCVDTHLRHTVCHRKAKPGTKATDVLIPKFGLASDAKHCKHCALKSVHQLQAPPQLTSVQDFVSTVKVAGEWRHGCLTHMPTAQQGGCANGCCLAGPLAATFLLD